ERWSPPERGLNARVAAGNRLPHGAPRMSRVLRGRDIYYSTSIIRALGSKVEESVVYALTGQLARIALLLVLDLQLPGRVIAATPPSGAHPVVFVCDHGSVKSLIAASYFNRAAQARGLAYRAVARGTAPESRVPPSVREGLREIGVDVSSYVPQA